MEDNNKIQDLQTQLNQLQASSQSINAQIERLQQELQAVSITQASQQYPPIYQPPMYYTKPTSYFNNNSLQVSENKIIKEKENIEKFIGKNAMGIGASILVFISLIMFSTLIIPLLGKYAEIIKMFCMYLVSFGLIGVGEYLFRKKKSGYTILTGCGVGALFISFVTTQFYFHFINIYVLYSFLLCWAVLLAFYLARMRNEMFLIVGQIGVFISVLWTLIELSSELELYLLVFYTIVAEASFFIAFYKSKKYHIDLINVIFCMASFLFLNASANIHLYNNVFFHTDLIANNNSLFSVWHFLLVLLTVFLFSYLAYFLNSRTKHFANYIIFIVSIFFINLLCSSYNLFFGFKIANSYFSFNGYWLALIYSLVLFVIFNTNRKQFNGLHFALISCHILISMSTLLSVQGNMRLPILLVLMAAMIATNLVNYEKEELFFALHELIPASFLFGFFSDSEDLCLVYLTELLIIITQMILYYKRHKEQLSLSKMKKGVKLGYEIVSTISSIVLTFVVSFMCFTKVCEWIKLNVNDDWCYLVLLISYIILLMILKKYQWASFENGMYFAGFINIPIMLLFLVVMPELEGVFLVSYIVLMAGLFSVNTTNLIKLNYMYGAYIFFKYTILILNILGTYNAPSLLYSFILLLISIVGILLGFYYRNKSIRIYGLVLSVIGIVKLILIDTWGATSDNTLLRAVCFLSCGLICFGISLLYNFGEKRLNAIQENSKENINTIGN